jgi:hypothetical protein
MELNTIIKGVSPPINTRIIHKQSGVNSDIIAALVANYPAAVMQAAEFAHKFKRPTRLETSAAIWHFLKKNATYKRDGAARQMIRLPRRFLYDSALKFNSGDCKSFSLFTASILGALGMPVKFRFASYKKDNPTPSHVYTVTKDETGRDIIIDAVYTKFNAEKPYFYKKDKSMTVETLAGIEAPAAISKIWIKRAARPIAFYRAYLAKLTPAQKIVWLTKYRAARQYVLAQMAKRKRLAVSDEVSTETINAPKRRRKRGKKIGQKIGRGIAKVALGAGRGAFLAVVALNLAGMATKMQQLQITKRFDKVKNLWLKLGGGMRLLNKAIKKGAKKKPIVLNKRMRRKLMKQWKEQGKPQGAGIGAAGAGAAAAAALPIIAAIIPVIAKAFKQAPAPGTETQSAAADSANVKELAQFGADIVQTSPAPGEGATATPGSNQSNSGAGTDQDETSGGEDMEGIYAAANTGGAPGSGGGAKFENLSKGLTEWGGKAIKFFGGLIKKRAKKKGKKGTAALNKLQNAGDSYFTGQYSKQRQAKSTAGISQILPFVAIGGIGIYLLTKKN